MSRYNNALIVLQAYPNIKFNVSNYFPLVNETISLENISEDGDSFKWTLDDSVNQTINTVDKLVNVTPTLFGDLEQVLEITNTVGVETLTKYIYPLPTPSEAYYEFSLNTNVARVGEVVTIDLINKYDFIGSHSILIVITDHNDDSIIDSFIPTGLTNTFILNNRGVYDIEIQVTVGTYVVYNKQGMIITITPALQDRGDALVHNLLPLAEADNFYGTPWSIVNGDNYNFSGAVIAPGTTIVLKKPSNVTSESIYRLRLDNLQGTAENPITVTIDETTPFRFGFESFFGIVIAGSQHVIIDGRGYKNLKNGLELFSHPSTTNKGITGFAGGGLTSNLEVHNLECHDIKFSGLAFKTDPNTNDPDTWRPTTEGGRGFTCHELSVHNCYMHDSGGEGFYIGYFDAGVKTEVNNSGEIVTYRAHELVDTKLYRNRFYRCGWDSLQANNLGGYSEIAYNTLIDSGWLGEFGQDTGMSISLAGSVHDNIINGSSGNGIQYMPFDNLEIYNNLIYNLNEGVNALYLLSGGGKVPETNVNGSRQNTIPIEVYNNNLLVTGKGSVQGAQNVTQFLGLRFRNNILRYIEGEGFTGMDPATILVWADNASDNFNLTTSNPRELKIASVDDGNFNHHITSTLTSGAPLIGSQYDIRGYKNWSDSNKFYGCYASIIRTPISILTLNSIIINTGDTTTYDSDVSILIDYSFGSPDKYRVSETPDFSGVVWETWVGSTINYTIIDTSFGVKNIYIEIGVDTYETTSQTDTIEIIELIIPDPDYLIDFGGSVGGRVSPSPWNNFNNPTIGVLAGNKLTGLIKQDGIASNLDLEITAPFFGNDENTSGIDEFYLHEATRDCYTTIVGQVSTLQLQNCDITKVYDIKLFASRGFSGELTLFTINGVTQSVNHKNGSTPGRNTGNIDTLITFSGIIADGAGNIDINVSGNDANTGYLNVMDITERPS